MNNKQKEKAKTINIFGVDVESVLGAFYDEKEEKEVSSISYYCTFIVYSW